MTAPFLIVDNTLPCDLPDLYDGISGHRRLVSLDEAAVRVGSRLWRVAFWIAVGLCVGVMIA